LLVFSQKLDSKEDRGSLGTEAKLTGNEEELKRKNISVYTE